MYCPYCGNEQVNNAKYCSNCGVLMVEPVAAKSKQKVQENPCKTIRQRKNRRIWKYAAAAALLLIVLGVAFFAISQFVERPMVDAWLPVRYETRSTHTDSGEFDDSVFEIRYSGNNVEVNRIKTSEDSDFRSDSSFLFDFSGDICQITTSDSDESRILTSTRDDSGRVTNVSLESSLDEEFNSFQFEFTYDESSVLTEITMPMNIAMYSALKEQYNENGLCVSRIYTYDEGVTSSDGNSLAGTEVSYRTDYSYDGSQGEIARYNFQTVVNSGAEVIPVNSGYVLLDENQNQTYSFTESELINQEVNVTYEYFENIDPFVYALFSRPSVILGNFV